jgi:hypothetical protein
MINGEYLEILEAQYPCDVMLMDKSGAQLSIMKSSEASFFSRPKEGFQAVQITSANAQSIRIFIGSGDAGTRRISSTVAVIDGGRARTVANAAFLSNAQIAGFAGNYGHVELFNPAASGKRAIVESVGLYSIGACVVDIADTNLQLASLNAYPQAKLLGGAASVMEYRSQANATLLGPVQSLMTVGLQASQQLFVKLAEPIIIPPGRGLIVRDTTQNQQFGAIFEFFEETI